MTAMRHSKDDMLWFYQGRGVVAAWIHQPKGFA